MLISYRIVRAQHYQHQHAMNLRASVVLSDVFVRWVPPTQSCITLSLTVAPLSEAISHDPRQSSRFTSGPLIAGRTNPGFQSVRFTGWLPRSPVRGFSKAKLLLGSGTGSCNMGVWLACGESSAVAGIPLEFTPCRPTQLSKSAVGISSPSCPSHATLGRCDGTQPEGQRPPWGQRAAA